MRHPIGYTRNGLAVHVDLIGSEAAKHIAKQPHLLGLIKEVVQQMTCCDPEVIVEHNMGRSIGYNFVIRTVDTDNVFYAQLRHDTIYTRFIKNGKPIATKYLVLVLRRDEDQAAYELQDAWIGRLRPPRPGDAGETADSKSYWANHAFVLDTQPLQMRTVTKTCPY